jgi:hypothetical protein
MRWVAHITHTAETRNAYKILAGGLKKSDYLEDLFVYGRIIGL